MKRNRSLSPSLLRYLSSEMWRSGEEVTFPLATPRGAQPEGRRQSAVSASLTESAKKGNLMTGSQAGTKGKEPEPARAVCDGNGIHSVRWKVPGATRYEVYFVPALPGPETEPVPVASGKRTEDLAFTPPLLDEAGAYAVLAFADGSPLPLAGSVLGTQPSEGKADISGYLTQWGEWSKLHPHKPNAKTPVGSPSVSTVKGVKRTKQTYSLTKNPDEVITFNPNTNTCFPGAIVQSGPAITQGYLIPAGIEDADRADITVTVDRLTGRHETASPPSASRVTAAIGKAVGDDAPGHADIVYKYTSAYSSTEVALELGVSASYGGFSASLDIDAKREEMKNTVMVYLRERAFTAFCDTSTPEALFKDTFTSQKVDKLINNGKMGPGKPPLLVNSVVYGRILTFTMTSKASETEINAALKAGYSGFADVSASVKAHYKQILKDSEISIIGVSVTPDMIKGLLTEGNLNDYFSKTKKYKEYGIIGYTLQTLDGVPAKMSESTTYDAVVWGGAGTVNLKFEDWRWVAVAGTSPTLLIDGEWVHGQINRAWPASGFASPFHIQGIACPWGGDVQTFTIELTVDPKSENWFANGNTKHYGRAKKSDNKYFDYIATKN
ncbi:thiol-activated cytolysin family protein [Streptomyces sp. NPDC048295]|uniref:thiol-activated cytolysin family protein n=1 Tax=Streptomyces sp. NPDC048295 TaxID=3154617 RepID=UPI0034143029